MNPGSRGITSSGTRRPQLPQAAEVLDVTLRDGGYLNDWQFSDAAVRTFVEALDRSGVSFVEVGYVSDDRSRPAALQCAPEYLAGLKASCRCSRLVAMLSVNEKSPEELSCCLRSRRDFVDVVRLPCLVERTPQVLAAAEIVAHADIACSVNLISITAYEPEEILACVEEIGRSGVADWLYLADSRGALLPDVAASLFAVVRRLWPGTLGFHAHDNLGMAVTNSQLALSAGFDLIDASLNGYGLGGGNTDLLAALALAPPGNPDHPQIIAAVQDLIARELPPRPPYQPLYPLAGLKNTEQEWVPDIWEIHGESSESFLTQLPWRRYKYVEEVLGVD